MTPSVSVVICTHNPRTDYLGRVLTALRGQTLPTDQWELLIVDNASKEAVASRFDIAWHSHGRHVLEPKLGLVAARIRGINEAKAEVLVFVDDDNVLDPEYLEQALRISREYPFLGAWGSGSIKPDFEAEPPAWAKPHLNMLTLCEMDRDVWANTMESDVVPSGAGQVIRSQVARTYVSYCEKNQVRSTLDRQGNSLISLGDIDLALTACDVGLGVGRFTCLRIKHLIPANRLQLAYFVKLKEDLTFSRALFSSIRRDIRVAYVSPGFGQRLIMRYYRMRLSREERALFDAEARGKERALVYLNGR